MIEFLNGVFNMKTNELILNFVLNNMILIWIWIKVIEYICQKTEWAEDDDLASFLRGLVNGITNFEWKKKGNRVVSTLRKDK